jgi:hypothetical protein
VAFFFSAIPDLGVFNASFNAVMASINYFWVSGVIPYSARLPMFASALL